MTNQKPIDGNKHLEVPSDLDKAIFDFEHGASKGFAIFVEDESDEFRLAINDMTDDKIIECMLSLIIDSMGIDTESSEFDELVNVLKDWKNSNEQKSD